MSGKSSLPSSSGSASHPELDRDRHHGEEDVEDVLDQLAQKERDLILAAELGKALLDSNQELQSRYDQVVEEFTHKMEELKQEKYDLHLELEKMEVEYQNALKDLQEDVISLRKQLRASDELQNSERERSRSLRDAQLNSDFLMEQVKKASQREEELLRELDEQKGHNDSNKATIKDQMDHIAMLREQVEQLSKKLRETTEKLIEVQGERDGLLTSLEMTQEQLQNLETQVSQQEEKIHRQASDIEELQEMNSDLQLQLDHQHQPYYRHTHYMNPSGINASINTGFNKNVITGNKRNVQGKAIPPQALFFELIQEKERKSHSPDEVKEKSAKLAAVEDDDSEANPCQHLPENSLFAELKSSQLKGEGNSTSLLADFSMSQGHGRNASDCSLSSLAEGSRKRHHKNIGGSSDDDSETDADKNMRSSSYKQTLYSELGDLYRHSFTPAAPTSTDGNGNQVLLVESSNLSTKVSNKPASMEEFHQTQPAFAPQDTLSDSLACSKSCSPVDSEKSLFSEPSSHSGRTSPSRHYSELNPHAFEFHPRGYQEQSLFTELSSQLYEDKNGSGSDSSSNCMLGVFDFYSGGDSQEGDRQSNESLNQSMEIRSRLESDLSCPADWYYMTPVTSEMLEEDDFECDDDDFLVGNTAGTTLSIGDSRHGLSYNYHFCDSADDVKDEKNGNTHQTSVDIDTLHSSQLCDHIKQQEQLTEACRQLKELVDRVHGQEKVSDMESRDVTTEDLLALVAQMRICVEKLTCGQPDSSKMTDSSTSPARGNDVVNLPGSTEQPTLVQPGMVHDTKQGTL